MKTMIRNGIVVPMNRNMDVWPDGYVVFEGSKILEAGPVDGLEAAIIRHGGENATPGGLSSCRAWSTPTAIWA